MASITKRVDRSIPGTQRYQTWDSTVDTNDDGNAFAAGDYFDFEASLGRAASQIVIEASSTDLEVRINGVKKVFDRASKTKFNKLYGDTPNQNLDLASGADVTVGVPTVTVGIPTGDSTYVSEKMPINTLQIVTFSSGTFTLYAF